VELPRIQIHQQNARLGIKTDRAELQIKQPRPTFDVHTTQAQVKIHSPRGILKIDQSKAWDALALGNILETMHRIHSAARQVALDGIARIVEEGNQMADISGHQNAIANAAANLPSGFPEFNFMGEPSSLNVSIDYQAQKPEIQVEEGKVEINTHPNKPEVNYIPGKVNYQMLQYQKVEITPPPMYVDKRM
jgi:hypothetical protein